MNSDKGQERKERSGQQGEVSIHLIHIQVIDELTAVSVEGQ